MFNSNYSERVGSGAPVYLAAVLKYSSDEVFELAGNDNNKFRITPCHLQLAICNLKNLNKLLRGVTIAQGDIKPGNGFTMPEVVDINMFKL